MTGLIVETGELEANPFFKDTHRFAAFGIDLRFAPGTSFGKAQAMEDLDDDTHAEGGADDGDEYRFASGLGCWNAIGWWGVDFSVGDEFLHGD